MRLPSQHINKPRHKANLEMYAPELEEMDATPPSGLCHGIELELVSKDEEPVHPIYKTEHLVETILQYIPHHVGNDKLPADLTEVRRGEGVFLRICHHEYPSKDGKNPCNNCVRIANHTELIRLATRWANKLYSFLWLDKLADAASEAARDTFVDDCCELDFVRRGHGWALKLNFVGFDIVYLEKKVRNAFVKINTIF